ncbi:DNA polymerase III subunit alpha [Sulfitobacter noctilucicola]|uniref:Uncharacterized protein n=1 Tax=Sulfitobacter noctilucicola TaxID=1342301 RepID=A0A7W6M9X8_9RHOB|nr:hypothetical protein [Sulfitobacter noctilucicola]KIN63638.1 DNA polymerase III subunit alpha [Sulfitobacter noctilucicola]MBB4174852.1 hypothetical protein [Sulfitobacter noctilucicola]
MLKAGVLLSAVLLVAACGDPLAELPRFSDVEVADTDPIAAALPSEDEVAREGFFGTAATAQQSPDQPLVDPVVTAPEQKRGLFGRLRGAMAQNTKPSGGADETLSAVEFEAAKSAESVATSEQTVLLERPAELSPLKASSRGGFFSRLTSNQPAPTAKSNLVEVEYGAVVPYGEMARSCASKRKPLGKKVHTTSSSGHTLYDSNPASTGMRTFYILGFDDGCPRQLTAAQVHLGEPSFYEQLHYGPAGQHLAVGATDKAYESVKGRVCGARKGKPCGSKMKRLERTTFFVNSYERLNENRRWSEQLVHDGQVVASSMKSNG